MSIKTKTCTNIKCGKIFPATLDYFYVEKRGKYGLKSKCKLCLDKRQDKYREYNSDKIKTGSKYYYTKNKKRILERAKRWRAKNSEKDSETKKQWKNNNQDKVNVARAKRRALKCKQILPLTDSEQFKLNFYYKISQYLGENWHVDHIVPLSKGGLHCPNNLQIVTKKYNLQKGNDENFRAPLISEIFIF